MKVCRAILALIALIFWLSCPRAFAQLSPAVPVQTQPVDLKTGNYYALVIGIDNYIGLPPLQTPVSDAQAVAEVLSTSYGFHIDLHLNATRADILQSMRRYRDTLKEDDNLLIYYAGHGFFDSDAGRTYWLPADADARNSEQWISSDDVIAQIHALHSRHVLLITDSSFPGYISRGPSVDATLSPEASRDLIRRLWERRSFTVMASGTDEPILDAGAQNHSIFAYALIRALSQETGTFSTASDLFELIRRWVAGRSPKLPMYAALPNVGHDGGDFVFRRLTLPAPAHEASDSDPNADFEGGEEAFLKEDYAAAARRFQASCESGLAKACSRLGALYFAGYPGAARDANKAAELYQRACDADDARGCALYGELLASGKGVPQNTRLARHYFEAAALHNDPLGQNDLGFMYFSGEGVEKDFAKARQYFEAADAQGNARAAMSLAAIYERGDGVPINMFKARALYQKAVDEGEPEAKQYLATIIREIADDAERRASAADEQRRGELTDLGSSSAVLQSASSKPRSYALLFATGSYENSKSWPPLPNPIPDADALANLLRYTFDFESVEVIRDARQSDVEEKVDAFLNHPYNTGDQLLIFFAGHGNFDDRTKEGFIVPAGALDLANDKYHRSLVSDDWLIRMISNATGAHHVLLILDTCFGGTIDPKVSGFAFRNPKKDEPQPLYAQATLPELLSRSRALTTRVYIASAGKEYVPDGVPGHHSPFTAALLRTLEAIADQKGFVTFEDLRAGLQAIKPQPVAGELPLNDSGANFIFVTKTAARVLAGDPSVHSHSRAALGKQTPPY